MKNEKQRYKELANFLKARRTRILPSQVGLPSGVRRRTPGLRREEVAQLAGIGLTWYTWLEQGRPIQVSRDIIESLCRVFLLDEEERKHLFTLAKQPIPAYLHVGEGSISPVIQHVIDSMELCPCFVMDPRWNILAWNKAASLVFGDFSKLKIEERNMIWLMFTNAEYKQLFIDWQFHAQGIMARFRSSYGQYVEDQWLVEFTSSLKKASKEFDLWWSRYEVQNNGQLNKELRHPDLGTLVFEFCSFDVSDNSGLKMIVNTPCAETDTAMKIKNAIEDTDKKVSNRPC